MSEKEKDELDRAIKNAENIYALISGAVAYQRRVPKILLPKIVGLLGNLVALREELSEEATTISEVRMKEIHEKKKHEFKEMIEERTVHDLTEGGEW